MKKLLLATVAVLALGAFATPTLADRSDQPGTNGNGGVGQGAGQGATNGSAADPGAASDGKGHNGPGNHGD